MSPGDVVLLCTYGLSNVVSDEDIALALAAWSDVRTTAAALIGIAGARGAQDDVTCVVLRWAAAAPACLAVGPSTWPASVSSPDGFTSARSCRRKGWTPRASPGPQAG